jgi:hypothetical protein
VSFHNVESYESCWKGINKLEQVGPVIIKTYFYIMRDISELWRKFTGTEQVTAQNSTVHLCHDPAFI